METAESCLRFLNVNLGQISCPVAELNAYMRDYEMSSQELKSDTSQVLRF